MKAIVYEHSGDARVLHCEETERPSPGEDQVLLRVHAAAANPLDWRLMQGGPMRLLMGGGGGKKTVPGRDVAGVAEAVGKNVTRFKPGDAVFGCCAGSFAEYAVAREEALAIKPESLSFEQAASIPIAGLTALQGFRDRARLRAGQKVLINGAAGGVGTFAVQVAKTMGADVTGVCSTHNVEMIRSLGADRVIDYTREDFTRGTERYDVIFDNVANRSITACRRVLQPNGICIIAGAPKEFGKIVTFVAKTTMWSWFARQKFHLFLAKITSADLAAMAELIAAKKVTPVIDRSYSLGDAPEAMRYLGTGHARGKLVVVPRQEAARP